MGVVSNALHRVRGKALKYMAVSAIGLLLTQVLIWFFHDRLDWDGVPTNIAAVFLTAIPSFLLNKRWVWARAGAHSWHREMVPFWAMSFAGLVLSTVIVGVVENEATHATWAVSLSNLAGFGVLWVAKFWVLDEYLFASDDK